MVEQNKTALVLDDEMLIALDVETMLFDLGYDQVTLLPSVPEALGYLDIQRPDVAVIDYHVRGKNSEAVLQVLKHLGVPTIIHSGTAFESEYHDEFLSTYTWLGKPSSREALAEALIAAACQSKLTTD